MARFARDLYARFVRPHLRTRLAQQRVKLVWFVWGYAGLLALPGVSLPARLRMLVRFLRIDWWVPHAHTPAEISRILRRLASERAAPGEGMVEAGCWMGGSTAKFSVACRLLGYRLWVYDSFEGVEPMSEEAKRASGYDFSGEYAALQEVVERNVARFGEPEVCTFFKGWFRDTLAKNRPPGPVAAAYIDCDLAKGTAEALSGILPALRPGGVVFTQDYHIAPVRALLADPAFWSGLHRKTPRLQRLGTYLAALTFPAEAVPDGASEPREAERRD